MKLHTVEKDMFQVKFRILETGKVKPSIETGLRGEIRCKIYICWIMWLCYWSCRDWIRIGHQPQTYACLYAIEATHAFFFHLVFY